MPGFAVELAEFGPKSAHTSPMICSIGSRWRELTTWCWWLGDGTQVNISTKHAACQGADVPVFGHEFEYAFSMQLRYNYRLYPAPGQQIALARAFGAQVRPDLVPAQRVEAGTHPKSRRKVA